MKAYVQQQNGQWLNENCYTVWYGLTRMGYEVHPFTMEDVMNNPEQFLSGGDKEITEGVVVHGGVNTIRTLFDVLGVEQPPIHNPQDYLPQYCNRSFRETTLGSVISEGVFPIFLKPLSEHKLFTGRVVNNLFDVRLHLNKCDENTPILCSEILNMVSEYRCFVNRGKLVGSKNYTGDFTKNIDYNIVKEAIVEYDGQPISYTLDFCVTDSGETVLIEINDGFSLGSYGLNPITYTKMIVDRWNEITNKKKIYGHG